jgi:hypothetical protein
LTNVQRPTLAEIYNTLNSLVDSYTAVMDTFGSVVSDVQQLRQDVADLRSILRTELADAVTGRDVWRATAEAHKREAEYLRSQLASLQQERSCG